MKHNLTFITPCFCAGAKQQNTEIRPSSIRGELRWWFRCLGGSREQENRVFGSIQKENPNSSAIQIRVSDVKKSTTYHEPTFISPNDPSSYHHYFLTAPNDKNKTRMWETPPKLVPRSKGKISKDAQLAQATSFTLHVCFLRSLSPEDKELFDFTLESFLHFGALGYRKTRGFGCWIEPASLKNKNDLDLLLEKIKEKGFSYQLEESSNKDPMQIFSQIETKLKGNKITNTGYRLNHPAKRKTPLGYSENGRQASAVRFRPVATKTKAGDTQYKLLIFQAPDTVLGSDTAKDRIIP